MRYVTTITLLVALMASAPSSGREMWKTGAMWEKSILAKKGQPAGCFYATVTGQHSETYSKMLVTLYFRNQPHDKKYSAVEFPYYPSNGRKDDFRIDDEFGDVLEACVPPGTYAIVNVVYSMGQPTIGPYLRQGQRQFQPVQFTVEEGKNYYLGNFLLKGDQHVAVRNMLKRDQPLIQQGAKKKPSTDLLPIELDLGDNFILRKE